MDEWTTERNNKLLRQKKEGKTNRQIANALGVSITTVKRHYSKLRQSLSSQQEITPVSILAQQEKEMVIKVEDCLVSADYHVPGEHRQMVKDLIDYLQKNKVKHMVIIGDFWNNDAVSLWQLKDHSMNLADEIKHGCQVLRNLMRYTKVYLVCGNHDARMPKALNYAISFSDWMQSLFPEDYGKRLFVTNFDHIFLVSGGKKFRLCHPHAYGRIKNSQVTAHAQDLQENIVMAHQHYISVATNKTGKYMAIDIGCMCDDRLFVYKRASTTRCPAWENSFLHIKNGKIRMKCWYNF